MSYRQRSGADAGVARPILGDSCRPPAPRVPGMLGAVNSKTTTLRILASLYLSAFVGMAFGQLASGPDPTTVADETVEAWLAQEPVTVESFQHLSAAEVCLALPALIQNPPPRAGTEVNLDDRRSLDTGDPNRLQFTYSATLPRERLEVVQVTPGAWAGWRDLAGDGGRVLGGQADRAPLASGEGGHRPVHHLQPHGALPRPDPVVLPGLVDSWPRGGKGASTPRGRYPDRALQPSLH